MRSAASYLKYAENEIDEIVNYAKGHATLKNAPHINFESLTKKGFTENDLQKIVVFSCITRLMQCS